MHSIIDVDTDRRVVQSGRCGRRWVGGKKCGEYEAEREVGGMAADGKDSWRVVGVWTEKPISEWEGCWRMG